MSNSLVEHVLEGEYLPVEEAVPIMETTSDDGQPLLYVDARDVHKWLGVKERFSRWFERRIAKHKMVYRQDYVIASDYPNLNVNENNAVPGGTPMKSTTYGNDRLDYFLTVDMAKHVVMASETEKGYEARNYFIKCERLLLLAQKREIEYMKFIFAQQLEIQRLRAVEAENRLAQEAARVVQYGYEKNCLQLSNKQLEKSLATTEQYHQSALNSYTSLFELYRSQQEVYENKLRRLENKVDSLKTENVYSSRPNIDNVIWLAKKHNFIK